MTITPFALIVGAYLFGAIPTAYLVARWLRGIDIRKYGSGNIGASNLSEHTSKWVGILLGTFDSIGKGTIPIVLANLLGQSLAIQAGVGLAAVVGHNWSPYLRFTGGRGIATTIGIMFAFVMWKEVLLGILLLGIIGSWWLKDTAFWTFAIVVALPGLAYFFGRPPEVVNLFAALAVVLLVKRLTGNWDWQRGQEGRTRVFISRLLWDRDVRGQEEWTRRGIKEKAK